MSKTVELLDHGYIRVVESWGSDRAVIEAARTSTQKGFLGWDPAMCEACMGSGRDFDLSTTNAQKIGKRCPLCNGRGGHDGDEKLLRYLWKNNHGTPFEFAGLVLELRAPIMVFREWHRHRTQSYNEASARYAPLPPLDYVPTVARLMKGGGHLTKQAAAVDDAPVLTEENAELFRQKLHAVQVHAEEVYQWALGVGVPKELARGSMTVFRYSTMRAAGNLRNWVGFERLRMAPTAQEEIRVYADAVAGFLQELFPRTYAVALAETRVAVAP